MNAVSLFESPPPEPSAQSVLREMVATPRITPKYWDAANAMELRHINTSITPEVPPEIADDLESRGFGDADQVDEVRWNATELRRNALPNNGIAVWWQLTDEACAFCSGKGEVSVKGRRRTVETECPDCEGDGKFESDGTGFWTDIDGNPVDFDG